MLYAWILFADAADDAIKKNGEAQNPPTWYNIPFIAAIVALFYFLIIAPGRKEKKQRQSMMSTLKKNDKIITSGGIIGVVVNLKEASEEVTIRSEETKLLILRSSIARIITEPEKESSTQVKPAT